MKSRQPLMLAVGLATSSLAIRALAQQALVTEPDSNPAIARDVAAAPGTHPPAGEPGPAVPAPVARSAGEAPPTNTMDDSQPAPPTNAASAYVIPDAPAFTLLGVTPSTIDRPATLTNVGAAVANLITPNGTVRSGAAIEVSPFAMGLLDRASAYDYTTSFWTRLLYRSALSLGTVSDSATALAPAQSRLAFGVRLTLIDESDPLLASSYRALVHRVIADCRKMEGPAERAACEVENYKKEAQAELKAQAVRWNAGGLSIAAAQSIAFSESRIQDGEADQFAAWTTGALPIGTIFQGVIGAKYVRNFKTDSTSLTLSERNRIGSQNFRGSLELSYTFNDPKDLPGPRFEVNTGMELKVSDKVWLCANVGGSFDQASEVVSIFALSNIKWSLEPNPKLPPAATQAP